MKAFWQLVGANAREFGRDTMSLFWFLAFPVLFILLFGSIFSQTDDIRLPIGLVVEDNGIMAQSMQKAIESLSVFTVSTDTREAAMAALRSGKQRAVVILPAGMSASLAQGRKVELPVYYDAAQQASRQVVLPVMGDVAAEFDRRLTARPELVSIQPEAMQAGNKLRDIDYLLPGILGMSLMQLGLFGTMRFVSLRERKVFKRLGATPLPKRTLIFSEVTVRLVMALVQTLLIVLIGQLLFGVRMVGSWPTLIGLVLLGAATFVSLGYMVAAFTHSEDATQGLIQAIQFPMMFLSGTFFPIEIMPKFLKPFIAVMPLTYLGDILRQVMVGAAATHSAGTDLLILVGTTLLTLAVAVRFFRWE